MEQYWKYYSLDDLPNDIKIKFIDDFYREYIRDHKKSLKFLYFFSLFFITICLIIFLISFSINIFENIKVLTIVIIIYFIIIFKYFISQNYYKKLLKSKKLFDLDDLVIFLNRHTCDEYHRTEEFKDFFISYRKHGSNKDAGRCFSDDTVSRYLIVPYTKENIIIFINSFLKTKHMPCVISNIYFLKNQDYKNLITHKKNNINYNETLEYVKNIFENKDSFISMALDDIYLKD